jgi:hypothetical protein
VIILATGSSISRCYCDNTKYKAKIIEERHFIENAPPTSVPFGSSLYITTTAKEKAIANISPRPFLID